MKHTIDGQIISLSSIHIDRNEIGVRIGKSRHLFVVTADQIAAFAVPVFAAVSLTIEAPAATLDPPPTPNVVVRGTIMGVRANSDEHADLLFGLAPIGDNYFGSLTFVVPLDVAKAFGGRLGEAATITITPVG